MAFQDLNTAFSGNDVPTSTARLLQSIIQPVSSIPLEAGRASLSLGAEQTTAIIRALFIASLDQFFEIHKWTTPESVQKEKEMSEAIKGLLQYALGGEIARTPLLLIQRFPELKDLHELCKRAQGFTSRPQPVGPITSPVELEEELSIWLLVRLLYCAALIRDAPAQHLPADRRQSRIEFVYRIEAATKSIHYYMFCSTDNEMRNVRSARAIDFAKLWNTINEEIRSMVMAWLEDNDQSTTGDRLGYIELLGTDRRTQIPISGGLANSLQLEQRPFTIPIFSQSVAINLLLTSLRIHLCILHHSIHFLDTIPSAIEALLTLWEYTMKGFPLKHNHRVLEDLIELTGWLFEESGSPAPLLCNTIHQEEPTYLGSYIKSRSPISLDKVCSAVFDQARILFASSDTSHPLGSVDQPLSQSLILLLVKILRWSADENGRIIMFNTSRSINRLIVKHGDSMIQALVSRSEAALNVANPDLQMISLSLLCCPMDIHSGHIKYSHSPDQTFANYQLLEHISIHQFESLICTFMPRWTQQVMAQKYGVRLGRFLHWLIESLQFTYLRLAGAKEKQPSRKRKRSNLEETDNTRASLSQNQGAHTTEHDLMVVGGDSDGCPTNLHPNLISLLKSCSTVAEVSSTLARDRVTSILLKSIERITTLISSSRVEDCETRVQTFQTLEREFDLLGLVICNSALKDREFLNSTDSNDLSNLPRDDLEMLFRCLLCDRCHLDPIDHNLPQLKFLPRSIFTSAIMLCYNSDLLSYPSQKKSKLDNKEKMIQDAKSGVRLAFIRFLTRVLNHTMIIDISRNNDSSTICTPEVNLRIVTVLERGSRMERIAAGRLLASIFSNSLHLLSIWQTGQLSDCQLQPVLDQLEAIAKTGVLRIQETLVIALILSFESTRMADVELIGYGRVELNNSISFRVCTILLRQMSRRSSYLLGVIRTEMIFLSRRIGVSVYTVLSSYLPSLSQFMVVELGFDSRAPGLLADLLGTSPEVLLIQTARYTLPFLVLNSHSTTIEAIAKAKDENIPQLLVNHAADIITHLCFQSNAKQLEKGAQTLYRLLNVGRENSHNPDLKTIDTSNLIEASAGSIYYRLIVEVPNEPDQSRRSGNIKAALCRVFQLKKSPPNWKKIPNDHEIQQELRSYTLPILSHINGSLQDLRGKISMTEKNKVMNGLGDLIGIIDSGVSSYIPQIMASLQASLAIPALRSTTLQTWNMFVKVTPIKDLKPFVGQITAAIVSSWSQMTPDQINISLLMLQHILRHRQDLGNYVFDIADLSTLTASVVPSQDFSRVHSALVAILQEQVSFKANLTWTGKLKNLIERINSENETVIRQSLKELRRLLEMDPEKVKMLMAGDTFHPLVGDVVKALIGVTARCNDTSDDIRSLAFECLGTVGAVDPDRCEISEEKKDMVLASNFADREESVDFALHLLQDELVGAYRSTNDSKQHNFLTYAIQELLKFCGFSQESNDPKRTPSNSIKKKWNSMPKHILDSISPLRHSKFKFSFASNKSYEVPIYNHTTVYSSWLKNWLFRLIPLVESQEASEIFWPFLGVIRNGDTVISQKLLPHIALHIVISGTPEELENIKLEIITVLEDQVERRSEFSPEGRQLVAQTIFGLMDHFSRYIRDRQKGQTSINESGSSKRKDSCSNDVGIVRVKSIISQVRQELIASAALYCKDHARALLNFEQQILQLESSNVESQETVESNGVTSDISIDEQLQNYYERAHEIYAAIDEPDGMEGISAKITAPSILHQIREHESTGRWTSAQSCWEVELQRQPDELRSHLGLLRCLRNLGHYDSLRAHILGVLQSHPDWESELAPFSVESNLVSNNWKGLTRAVQVGSPESPEVIFGKVVDMLLNSDEQSFNEAMKDARIRLGNQILGASRKDAYKRMYESAIYLHILHEVPLIDRACCEDPSNLHVPRFSPRDGLTSGRDLMNHLDFRLESISPAFRYQEQLLRLRRATFQLRSRAAPAVGQLWVQTAKIARKAGHLQTAYSAVLQASELKAPTAFIQQAKLMKLEDQPYKAILKLDENLKKNPVPSTDGSFDRLSEICPRDYAKAALQRVRWMDEVDRYPANVIVDHFEKLCRENPSWSSSFYYFGRFYDERASQAVPSSRTSSSPNRIAAAEYTYHCCKNFQKSLALGTKFIYQALPRLLTMYFSFGEHPDLLQIFKTVEKKKRTSEIRHDDYTQALRTDELGAIFLRLDKVIQTAVKRLPVFEWLTVLPQVVSRVMHKSTHVQAIVHKILTHVLRSYPDQALWAMVSGVESSNSARSSRCSWVLQDATDAPTNGNNQSEQQNLAQKIEQCRKMVKQLLKLCNFPIKNNARHLSLNNSFAPLQQCTPCDLIVPVQHSLIATFPPNDVNLANHQPFPLDLPYIQSFADKITIMTSLQKPRKIGIIGSDGKEYPFLCKPKDDLRKDARLMEFNSMINKLLKKDSESRKRNLHIRTYAVVVLNEECGLLEWVPNTIPFRNILIALYQTKGIAIWSAPLKTLSDKIRKHRDDWNKVKEIFENEVLSLFPSVFHQWFLNNFPDPTSWLKSRQAYGRTCAVMSMVGFVLGLGDRHGENILFDSTNGDVVHVDFNCLFDKGRTFEVSENVPFRLTHNLVSGLGITGVEGVFRRASEVTMGILRNNKDSLMSVLETFVHDPLVDWMPSVSKRKGTDAPTEEYVAREAKKSLEPISRKLTGFQITSSPSGKTDRQMSTENQVDSLINEARDNRHLGRMYFGWAPYL